MSHRWAKSWKEAKSNRQWYVRQGSTLTALIKINRTKKKRLQVQFRHETVTSPHKNQNYQPLHNIRQGRSEVAMAPSKLHTTPVPATLLPSPSNLRKAYLLPFTYRARSACRRTWVATNFLVALALHL